MLLDGFDYILEKIPYFAQSVAYECQKRKRYCEKIRAHRGTLFGTSMVVVLRLASRTGYRNKLSAHCSALISSLLSGIFAQASMPQYTLFAKHANE